MEKIIFSIIIPVKSINDYVRESIKYIEKLEGENWELIILPNEQETNEWNDSRISIYASGKVGPAKKRDIGATISNGEILVFLDDDSYPNSDLLKVARPYFQDKGVVAIGGPAITPTNNNYWQKVSGSVYLSKFSGGNPERYVSLGKVKEVDDWPSVNLMVRKEDFLQIGGFKSEYWPGEDTLLCFDLIKKTGKKILYVPELIVWHHRRSGFFSHLKQVGAYGLHRGFFFKTYPENSRKLKYTLPSMLVIFLFFLIFLSIFNKEWFEYIYPLSLLYVTCLILAWIDISKHTSIKISSTALIYTFFSHLWYGINFIKGLLSKKIISKLN